ncbi:Hypothetical protein NAEGRDRAFT_67953 [Naegleria gruberi]|uniref:F-box domain-containing protein n=1 Tax=Naegleria gruberi TaxID=5762 RepID=D2VGF0_NAEGR|nr:uncharacterized protein NAEGRDRAFT_67953 [Naegleria gruberi]EFC43956.1 Hypothetical protein NAEGRDRAFT_67953 [Naegleria gruberi]|eukprot:XP_002676700.1 Hypothetical protein NAEGRDRAFT_67953 [Naegleria gruberi strain NEG-M]
MKRKETTSPSQHDDVQECKKAKHESTTTSSTSHFFSTISNDEFLCILYSLESESILSLSRTCKSMQHLIKNNVLEYLCKYSIINQDGTNHIDNDTTIAIDHVREDEKILKALKNRELFRVDDKNYESVLDIIEDICDRNGTLSDFTHHLKFDRKVTFEEVFDLMDCRLMKHSYRKEYSNNQEDILGDFYHEEMIVNCVLIEELLYEFDPYSFDEEEWMREPIEDNSKSFQLVKIIGIPIGYTLKELTLANVSFNELFLILSKCNQLESLIISDFYLSMRRYKEEDEEESTKITEEYEEHCFFIPTLKSMKKFELRYSRLLPRESTLLNILKCCPNLETVYFCFLTRLDKYLLQKIPQYCTNLTNVTFLSDSGSTPLESIITDSQVYEFMKSQPKLKYLKISPCININGSIFANIGEFQKLEYLELDVHAYNSYRIPQIEEIVFGGGEGILPNLKHLNVGKLEIDEDALYKFAPNLISFECDEW